MITEGRITAITTTEECELNIELCGERLDSANLFTVIAIVADHQGYSLIGEFLQESDLATQLIEATQSNYEQSRELIEEMAQYADRATELGENE